IVLEPWSGSAVFLIAAMNWLRPRLFGAPPQERHQYFVNHLAGIEKDPFAIEISRLALTLADFPNPDGWHLVHEDVFKPGTLDALLGRAGVVLCNPPFEDFTLSERSQYNASTPRKPAELLKRVLRGLHPGGILGFVLPRTFLDGRSYAEVRLRLAERYASLETTVLPDKVFPHSDSEPVLLLATDPIPHKTCTVRSRRVDDTLSAWKRFELMHEVSLDHVSTVDSLAARDSLVVPELPALWEFLIDHPTLGDIADVHLGIEWKAPLRSDGKETGK